MLNRCVLAGKGGKWRAVSLDAHRLEFPVQLAQRAGATAPGADEVIADVTLNAVLRPELEPEGHDGLWEEAAAEADMARLSHPLSHPASQAHGAEESAQTCLHVVEATEGA